MKLGIVIVALCIAVSTHANSLEDRRWKPIFPKNSQRFVVTMKSISPSNNSTSLNRPPKKPLMLRIIPKAVKIKGENYWHRVTTRKPLMRFTKFTVNPLTTTRTPANSITFKNIHKVNETDRKYKTDLFNKMMQNAPAKDDSSEEISDSSAVTENKKNRRIERVKSIVSPFREFKSRVIDRSQGIEHTPKPKEIIGKSHNDKDDSKITGAKFSSEEKEDREEFIFVNSNRNNGNVVKTTKYSVESEENTTVAVRNEARNRRRRSINVIEEENLGTTVSGFKFTGQVASLSSDLVFRNINT